MSTSLSEIKKDFEKFKSSGIEQEEINVEFFKKFGRIISHLEELLVDEELGKKLEKNKTIIENEFIYFN